MNEFLKPFILYCQFVESLYMEWKNYWLDKLTNKPVDMYKDYHEPF